MFSRNARLETTQLDLPKQLAGFHSIELLKSLTL